MDVDFLDLFLPDDDSVSSINDPHELTEKIPIQNTQNTQNAGNQANGNLLIPNALPINGISGINGINGIAATTQLFVTNIDGKQLILPNFNPQFNSALNENILKRKRDEPSPEELKIAAKRQKNKELAQKSRERKKKYIESLEKENANLKCENHKISVELDEKVSSLLSSKIFIVLICVAFLMFSQNNDEIPQKIYQQLDSLNLPMEIPKDISYVNLILEDVRKNELIYNKQFPLFLPNNVLQSIRSLPSDNIHSETKIIEDSDSISRIIANEIQKVFNKQNDSINIVKDSTARRKRFNDKDKGQVILIQSTCNSEDSDDEHNQ